MTNGDITDEQRKILLIEYQVCEQDNDGNFQGYWTLAGIFIGVSSALLAGLIYGVMANDGSLRGILFHYNSKIALSVGLIALICAVWVIYDVFTKQKQMNETHKIIWTVCAIIGNIITAAVYYFVVKMK